MFIKIPRKKEIITALCAVSIVLIALSVFGQIYKFTLNDGQDRYLTTIFNLDAEVNFPTFLSMGMLLFCSVLLVLIGRSRYALEVKYRWHWIILGLIFFGMAVDEMLQLHEMTIPPIRNYFHTTGVFHFAWVIPAGFFLVVLFLFYLKFLGELPGRFKNLFFLSASVYIGGAFGIEMIGGLIASGQGENSLFYALVTNTEESMEIFGLILFIYTLLAFIESLEGDIALRSE